MKQFINWISEIVLGTTDIEKNESETIREAKEGFSVFDDPCMLEAPVLALC